MPISSIKVTPNAKRSKITLKNSQINVKVQAPPEDGKANVEVVKTFKEQLNLNIEIIKGIKQREKTITCTLSFEEIVQKLKEKN